MNRKQYLIIFVVCLLPFFGYLLRPTLWNTDTYYFASISCGLTTANSSIPILSNIFFAHFPCSEIAFKSLFFVIFLISSIILAKIGELYSSKYGWYAPIFANIAVNWAIFFSAIEDDVLAFPILLLGLYCFARGSIEKNQLWKFAAVLITIFSGLIWKGSLLFLIAYATTFFPALIILILIVILIFQGEITPLWNSILPHQGAIESWPLIGFFQNWILNLGLLGLWDIMPGQFLFFAFIALATTKNSIILVAMLAVACTLILEWCDSPKKAPWSFFSRFPRLRKNLFFVLKLWAILTILIVSFYHIPTIYPHANQIQAVNESIEIAGDDLFNDWSYGYYIMFNGGTPSHYGGEPSFQELANGKYYLTERDLVKDGNCNPIRYYGVGFVDELALFRC